MLPGIYLAHNGGLTVGQREIAAVLYAGRGCAITGLAALRREGVRLRLPLSDPVDVLIPATARRLSVGFVRIHQDARQALANGWHLLGASCSRCRRRGTG